MWHAKRCGRPAVDHSKYVGNGNKWENYHKLWVVWVHDYKYWELECMFPFVSKGIAHEVLFTSHKSKEYSNTWSIFIMRNVSRENKYVSSVYEETLHFKVSFPKGTP